MSNMQKLYNSCGSLKELVSHCRSTPLKSLRFMFDEKAYEAIMEKIDFRVYGEGKVNIIDYNNRVSPLTLHLNAKLKPKHHLIYPDGKGAFKFWERIINDDADGLVNVHITDPPIANTIKANIMVNPIKNKWLEPRFLTQQELKTDVYGPGRTPVNESLLFVADFTSTANANCLRNALYYNEVQTCMFRYSGVKFLAWAKPSEVLKYITDVGTLHRRTNSLMAGLYSDVRLIACSKKLSSARAEKMIQIYRETDDYVEIEDPTGEEYCLIEFQSNHNKYKIEHQDDLHFCIHKLFASCGSKLKDKLHTLGPGAEDYLSKILPQDMLEKKISDLSNQDFVDISDAFWGWPFKPDINLELFNEQDHFNDPAME